MDSLWKWIVKKCFENILRALVIVFNYRHRKNFWLIHHRLQTECFIN